MSSRVYFHSLYKTRDYSYSSSLESPTFHFGFKGVDYRTLTRKLRIGAGLCSTSIHGIFALGYEALPEHEAP